MISSILRSAHAQSRGLSAERTIGLLLVGPFLICALAGRPFMLVATLAYYCLLMGIAERRRNRGRHAQWMGLGMTLDLLVVLVLEIQRDAVATALGMALPPLQQAHILMSAVAVTLYLPLIVLGLVQFDGRSRVGLPGLHRRLGLAAFTFRTLGFLLMFSLLAEHG